MEKETPHTPEDCARHINNIKEHKRTFGEKTLEEMLFIFEHQGYISQPQDVCFMSIITHYKGNKFNEYMDRYLKVK